MAFREPAPRPQPQLQKTPPNGRGPGAVALATAEPPASPPPAKLPQKEGRGCASRVIAALAFASVAYFGYELWKDYNAKPAAMDNPPPAMEPAQP